MTYGQSPQWRRSHMVTCSRKHSSLVLLEGAVPPRVQFRYWPSRFLSPLQRCLGWNSYLKPVWRASISEGRFPLGNILVSCIIGTCLCSEERRSSSMIELSHPSCTESIWTGPSLTRTAVTETPYLWKTLLACSCCCISPQSVPPPQL